MRPETVLAQIPLFTSVPARTLRDLAATAHSLRFQRTAKIVAEGEQGDSMYVLLSGRVAVSRLNEDGVRVHFDDLKQGDFFGELSLLSGRPRSADVISLTRCECLVIDQDSFVQIALSTPESALGIIVHLCGRLSESNDARTFRPSVRTRMVKALLQMATDDSDGVCVARTSRKDLAERITARRETVSRELSALARDGLVAVEGRRVLLMEPAKLRKLTG